MQNKKVLIVADPSVYYDGSKRVVPYDEEISMYRDALVQYGIPCEVIDRLGDLSRRKDQRSGPLLSLRLLSGTRR